jgi:hypothetical protein
MAGAPRAAVWRAGGRHAGALAGCYIWGRETYGEPPETEDRLIEFADASMYAAKQKGKNRSEHQCS